MPDIAKCLREKKIDEKQALILVFIVGVLLRFLFSFLQPHIVLYTDELLLLEVSRNLSHGFGILVRGIPFTFSGVLYPFILAPAQWLGDSVWTVIFIKFINSMLMNSALLPVYLLAKKIAPSRAFLVALISLIIPDMCFVSSIFAEVLLYPAVMWFLLAVYQFISCEKKILPLFLVFAIGFGMYFIKASSLYFLMAFFLYLVFYFFLKSSVIVRAVIITLISISIFLLLLFANSFLDTVIFPDLTYLCPDRLSAIFRYAFYYFIYNAVGCGVFFIILPLLSFKNFSQSEKQFLFYLYFALFSGILMVVLIVSMNEDYPRQGVTPHLRYIFYFVVPFLLIFIKSSFSQKKWVINVFGFLFFILLIIGIVRFSEGNYTACMLLGFLRESLLYPVVELNLNIFKLKTGMFDIVKLVILIYTICGIYMIRKNSKMFKSFVIIVFVIISLLNNFLCYKSSAVIDKDTSRLIGQVIKINNNLQNSKILFVSRYAAGDKVFETYTRQKYFYTTQKYFDQNIKNLKETSVLTLPLVSMQWSLKQKQLNSQGADWHKLDFSEQVSSPIIKTIDVDYIVTGRNCNPPLLTNEKKEMFDGVYDYKIYKIKN